MPTPDSSTVYQLRIRLDRISPLIWRRLLVTDATTIAQLHTIIQFAFGWSDSHLHRFVIHGKSYGIAYAGGMTFADDPHQVRLAAFGFRPDERFSYEYNFHVPWRHEIRVEQILSPAPDQRYPICSGGARAVPPEECGGPDDFLALRQQYHPLSVIYDGPVCQDTESGDYPCRLLLSSLQNASQKRTTNASDAWPVQAGRPHHARSRPRGGHYR